MIRIIKMLIYIVFVVTIHFTFIVDEKVDVSQTNFQATEKNVLKNHSVVWFKDYDLYDQIDKKYLLENFDLVIISRDTVFSNVEEINDLYGQTSTCIVPFSHNDSNCDYVIMEYGPNSNFRNFNNFDINILDDVNNSNILINNDEITKFSSYLNSNFNISSETEKLSYEFDKFNYGYFTIEYVSKGNDNYIFILLFILMITTVNVLQNRKYVNIMRINGVNDLKVIRTISLKDIIYDIAAITLLYSISALILYFRFENNYLVSEYFDATMYKVLLLLVSVVLATFVIYVQMLFSNTYEYLNTKTFKKKGLYLLTATYLLIVIFILIQNSLGAFSTSYISYKKEIYRNRMNDYNIYYVVNDEINLSSLTSEEVEEIRSIILNDKYEVYDYINNVRYMSVEYASILFNYDYKDKNVFLNKRCSNSFDTDLDIDTPNTKEYKYSDYNMSDIVDTTCYVVVYDDEGYFDELSNFFITLSFYDKSDDVDKNIRLNKGTGAKTREIYLDFYINLTRIMTEIVILVISSISYMLLYVSLFSREEALKYIISKNDKFLGKFIFIKLLTMIILGFIFIFNLSYIFILMILLTDLITYMVISKYYKSNLTKLMRL